jgi:hypothetical protein
MGWVVLGLLVVFARGCLDHCRHAELLGLPDARTVTNVATWQVCSSVALHPGVVVARLLLLRAGLADKLYWCRLQAWRGCCV